MTTLSRLLCHWLGHRWEPAGGRLEVCTRAACRGSVDASRWTA